LVAQKRSSPDYGPVGSGRATASGGSGAKRAKAAAAAAAAAAPTPLPTAVSPKDGSAAAKWHAPRQEWVFTGSGLSEDQKAAMRRLAAAAGARIVDHWQPSVTHVICTLSADGRARRTVKYLAGLLIGAWVVGADWVGACLEEGAPVDEGAFEATGDTAGFEGAPRRGREEGRAGRLLAGVEVYLAGPSPAKEGIATLLRSAGAALLSRLPPTGPDSTPPPNLLVLVDPEALPPAADEEAAVLAPAAALGAPLVQVSWLMDSVSNLRRLEVEGYRYQPGRG